MGLAESDAWITQVPFLHILTVFFWALFLIWIPDHYLLPIDIYLTHSHLWLQGKRVLWKEKECLIQNTEELSSIFLLLLRCKKLFKDILFFLWLLFLPVELWIQLHWGWVTQWALFLHDMVFTLGSWKRSCDALFFYWEGEHQNSEQGLSFTQGFNETEQTSFMALLPTSF